jgi:uncharacterized membrane protein YkvA (DUF1232 family)
MPRDVGLNDTAAPGDYAARAMGMIDRWRGWARALKREAHVMYVALRDPRTPWYARAAAACVVAYALSPIDLIPDPIPVLGYLDDLILLPGAIWLVRKMIPPAVLAESRALVDAGAGSGSSRIGRVGAIVIAVLWVIVIVGLTWGGIVWWRR